MLEGEPADLETIERCVGDTDAMSRIDGKGIVEKGVVARHSRIRGLAIVGAGARLLNFYVGPFTSILAGIEIGNAEIEHSIIREGSRMRDIGTRIEDSFSARNVRLHRVPAKPQAYRFMVADNSEVGIRS